MDATTSAQIFEYYRDLATNQHNYYTLVVALIGSFFTISSGAVIFWNLNFAKKDIKNKVDEEVEEKIKEIENKINLENNKKLSDEIKKYESNFDNRLNETEAKIARNYASMCIRDNSWGSALVWAASALKLYILLDDNHFIRVMTDTIVHITKKQDLTDNLGIDMDSIEKFNKFKKIIEKIPDVLEKEKKEIQNNIKVIETFINTKKDNKVVETGEVVPPQN